MKGSRYRLNHSRPACSIMCCLQRVSFDNHFADAVAFPYMHCSTRFSSGGGFFGRSFPRRGSFSRRVFPNRGVFIGQSFPPSRGRFRAEIFPSFSHQGVLFQQRILPSRSLFLAEISLHQRLVDSTNNSDDFSCVCIQVHCV